MDELEFESSKHWSRREKGGSAWGPSTCATPACQCPPCREDIGGWLLSEYRNSYDRLVARGQQLLRGAFGRSLMLLMGSTAVGHLMVLATLPLIGRLYLPEDLGRLGTFLAFLGVASVGTSLRYDIMIVASETEAEASSLVAGVCWLTVPLALAWGAVMALLIGAGVLGFEVLPVEAPLWMFPALVATQLFFTLRYWLMRSSDFHVLAKVTIGQNFVRAVAPIVAYPIGGGWIGLVASEVASRVTGIGEMLRKRGGALRIALAATSAGAIRVAFAKYREAPLAGFPSALINAASNAVPLPLIAGLFGAASAGYFSLVQRALQAPIGLISRNVADVFHARLAEHARAAPHAAIGLFWRTALFLLVLGGIPSALILAVGRPLLVAVMGSRWQPAAELLVAMVPWTLAMFVVSPLSRAVVVYRGQVLKLIYDVISLAAVAVVFYWSSDAGWSLQKTVWILSCAQAGTYIVYFFVLLRLLQSPVGSRPEAE